MKPMPELSEAANWSKTPDHLCFTVIGTGIHRPKAAGQVLALFRKGRFWIIFHALILE
jgi:hypothetical protein